jgi:hypothetical protein
MTVPITNALASKAFIVIGQLHHAEQPPVGIHRLRFPTWQYGQRIKRSPRSLWSSFRCHISPSPNRICPICTTGLFRLDTMPSSPAFALRRRGEKDRLQNLTEVPRSVKKNDLRPCFTETIMWSQRLPHLILIACARVLNWAWREIWERKEHERQTALCARMRPMRSTHA